MFLSELFFPHGRGAELATYLYAKTLSNAGTKIIVVTNRFGREPDCSKEPNLTIYRIPMFKKSDGNKYSILQRSDLLLSSSVRKVFQWADIIYIPRFWFSAIPLARTWGKPVVVHIHDYIPVCPLATICDISKRKVCSSNGLICSGKCIYTFEKGQGRSFPEALLSLALNSTFGRVFCRLVRLSDAVIFVSNAQRTLITERLPTLGSKSRVIYNPLPDISRMSTEGDDFGYFGGGDPLKGFGTLYDALNCINHHQKQITVHATGFFDYERRRPDLLEFARIRYYPRLHSPIFEQLYKRIRAVIVPSLLPEPLPYVVSEAILRGRAVVASNVGGIPEQVEGCKASYLFKAGNHSELAEKMQYVGELSEETVEDLTMHDREVLTKRFSVDKAIGDFLNVCHQAKENHIIRKD